MSFANLLANLLSMDYPLFHLVSTEEMKEAIRRGASVTAVVGDLTPDSASEEEMVPVRFPKNNGVLHAYQIMASGETDLGEILLQQDKLDLGASQACSLITVPSHIRVEQEKPGISLRHFLREHLGLLLAIPMGSFCSAHRQSRYVC